jgi:superfamily II DNA or RNA helicase
MKLRDYQQECSNAVWKELGENEMQSTLVVLPTGGGKTIVFSDVIRRFQPMRCLVLAHREELIWQARDKIERVTGLHCEIEMADLRAQENLFHGATKSPVVISTIQTQISGCDGKGRMSKFNPMEFALVVVDEAHHSVGDSYVKVLDYYKSNPDIRILGVTATPDRADEEALGQIFQSVAFDYEILDAIQNGWLVNIMQQSVHIAGLDFSSIRTTAGDLNGADLAAVMETEKNLHGVATATVEMLGARRAIAFTVSVNQAEILCEIFNRHRQTMAEWVCGETPKDQRREILQRFKEGKTQVVVNCGVLTEGFDDAGVEVIVMARPTKSRSLFAQMVGRSTRPLEGIVDPFETKEERLRAIETSSKPFCTVLDFIGNTGKHKLISAADILGGKVSDEAVEATILKVKQAGKAVPVTELLEEEEKRLQEEAKQRRLLEEARRAKLVAKAKYTTKIVNPFDVWDISPGKSRGWDSGKQLSEKQKAVLLKQGINTDGMPYVQAHQLLMEQFRRWDQKLCSFKQSAFFKKRGMNPNVSREEAKRIIDEISKKEGWGGK